MASAADKSEEQIAKERDAVEAMRNAKARYRIVEPANDPFEPCREVSPFDDDSECVEDMAGWGGRAGLASVFLICVLIGLLLATGGAI